MTQWGPWEYDRWERSLFVRHSEDGLTDYLSKDYLNELEARIAELEAERDFLARQHDLVKEDWMQCCDKREALEAENARLRAEALDAAQHAHRSMHAGKVIYPDMTAASQVVAPSRFTDCPGKLCRQWAAALEARICRHARHTQDAPDA